MQRRRFLEIAALAPALSPALAAAEAKAPGLGNAIGPYLQNPAADAMTVMLLTRGEGSVTVEADTGTVGRPTATRIEGTPWTVWKARIRNITEGPVRYHTEWTPAGGDSVRSPEHVFQPFDPATPEARFVIFNDVHYHHDTLAALLDHVKPDDYDFSCLLGDIWNDPSPKDGACKVFETLDLFVRSLDGASKPLLFVRGNHEVRGGFKDRLAHLFDIPVLDPEASFDDQNWWYSHRIGPLFLIATDTGEDDGFNTAKDSYKRPDYWQSYRKRQVPWIDELAASGAANETPWTLFLSHIPLYNPARWHSDPSREFWEPGLEKLPIDLMIAGHDHSWKFVPEKKPFSLKQKDAEGTETEKTFTPPWPILIGGGPKMHQGTVTKVAATADRLDVRLVHTSGKLLHEVQLG